MESESLLTNKILKNGFDKSHHILLALLYTLQPGWVAVLQPAPPPVHPRVPAPGEAQHRRHPPDLVTAHRAVPAPVNTSS